MLDVDEFQAQESFARNVPEPYGYHLWAGKTWTVFTIRDVHEKQTKITPQAHVPGYGGYGFSQAQQGYGSPPGYGPPAPGYGPPAPGYGPPAPGYGSPAPYGYGSPPPQPSPALNLDMLSTLIATLGINHPQATPNPNAGTQMVVSPRHTNGVPDFVSNQGATLASPLGQGSASAGHAGQAATNAAAAAAMNAAASSKRQRQNDDQSTYHDATN